MATPVVAVRLVEPVALGVNPAVPTTRFHVVEPPVVQVNVAEEEVTSVIANADGSGHRGWSSTTISSIAISPCAPFPFVPDHLSAIVSPAKPARSISV